LLLRRTKITLLLVMVSLQIFFSRNYQTWRFIIQLSQAILGSGLWAFVQMYMERITQQMLIKLTVHCWVYLILTFQIETFTIWSTRLNILLCLFSIFLAYGFKSINRLKHITKMLNSAPRALVKDMNICMFPLHYISNSF
jgi:hypothetical protein